MRRKYPQDWELRDLRFEELDSEEEDAHGGVLDPRDARARSRFVSDELYFDGYDLGRDRSSRGGTYDRYGEEMGYRDYDGMAYQTAVRDKEDALVHTALERIAKARAKGRTNVNLSEEEMVALERRRDPQPEPSRPSPLASPPPTPAKAAGKAKVGSRSNSSGNLASKTRKRSSGLFGSSPSPVKSNSKAKVKRTTSAEQALPYPVGRSSPRMIEAPNGVPTSPYFSQDLVRSQSSRKAASRPSSKQRRRRDSSPPDRSDPYPPYPHRHYYPPPGMRPESSGSNRSLPDDETWYPPPPRHRSASNVPYASYPTDYDSAPALPAAQSRRHVSGPPDVRYANPRRGPASSALAARPAVKHSSHSDPSSVGGARRVSSGLSQEIGESSSSSSSSDEQGVEVELLPEGAHGREYSIVRAPAVNGNEGRRRKSGRR